MLAKWRFFSSKFFTSYLNYAFPAWTWYLDEIGGAFGSSPKMEPLKKRKGREKSLKESKLRPPSKHLRGSGLTLVFFLASNSARPQNIRVPWLTSGILCSLSASGVWYCFLFAPFGLLSQCLVGPHCFLAAPSSFFLPPATSHPTPEIVPWTWRSIKIFLQDPYPWHFTFKIDESLSHAVTGNEQNAPWVFEPNRMVRLCARLWCQTPWAWILAGNRNNNGNNNGSYLLRLL